MTHYDASLFAELRAADYPTYALEVLASVEKRLDEETAFAAAFDAIYEKFYVEKSLSGTALWQAVEDLAAENGVNPYTLDFILLLNGAPLLKAMYDEMGLDESFYQGFIIGLKAKLLECIECKEVPGTFVGFWFEHFYNGKLFRVKRFECMPYFEYELEDEYTMACGKHIRKGTHMVELHIPSHDLPLTDEVRMESYKEIYRLYHHLFEDGIMLFMCDSWLLYPRFPEFLPANSNVLKFLSDFENIKYIEPDTFDDGWRLFNKDADLPAAQLPRDTSFRRAYADWLASGHNSGFAWSCFAFDGEKILR